VGLIGPGTTRQLQTNWNSPFESSNIGGVIDKTMELGQVATGITSITTLSSTQVYEGTRPLTFNLNLVFYALSDAYQEVMLPLQLLEEFASPQVNKVLPGGRIPGMVTLNFGKKMIIPNCVIENITIPLDKERDSKGNLIRAEVQMQISTKVMLNRSEIAGTW
jgi:hypothetical protein